MSLMTEFISDAQMHRRKPRKSPDSKSSSNKTDRTNLPSTQNHGAVSTRKQSCPLLLTKVAAAEAATS
jgi:hypothetical protein